MKPLEKMLRNKLEKTVKEARDIAEAAARASLEQLGVGEASPFIYLSEDQKELRRKLRAHGRQLGDQLNPETGTQEIDRLVEETAYEHWHRMLFARFLAENNLLMYPDPDVSVAVTLEECEELAVSEGAKNGWELASRYAARMLPQIFRPDSPVFHLTLPPEHQQKLEKLLVDLPSEVFTASDSLGWVYQFWQAKKKNEVNGSEVKIGARELPAVTQLFTEPYMVSFLLDNSLGAWWAAHRLTEKDLKSAVSEEELRQKASLPSVPLEYLRFVKTDDDVWTPAAGAFDGWPESLSELKTLDPCGGSGHFLVAAFLMLVPMRMEIEDLSAKDAVDAVLNDNLHGLEIDQRCVELAAFTLALTAWRYPSAGGYRILPELNIACSGATLTTKKEDWLALADNDERLKNALEKLYLLFQDASVLGSLINPRLLKGGTLIEASWAEVKPLLVRKLSKELNDDSKEMGVVAQGIIKAAELLYKKYHLLVTNVPFRQNGDFNEVFNRFADTYYPTSKSDIATVFYERISDLLTNDGCSAVVMPQGFLYKDYYAKFRKKLFSERKFSLIARLGANAFREINGEEVKVCLIIAEHAIPERTNLLTQMNLTEGDSAHKEILMPSVHLETKYQKDALTSSKNIVTLNSSCSRPLLENYASYSNGIQTGDYPRFGRFIWELPHVVNEWEFQLSTVTKTTPYGGREHCLLWEQGNGQLIDFIKSKIGENQVSSWVRGLSCRGKLGIAISAMGELKATLYTGELFDDNTVVIIPEFGTNLESLWCFCSSENYNSLVRGVDQSNKVRGALLRVPFEVPVTDCEIPPIYSEDPTQWIFHGHPAKSNEPLQVAVARLLGYRWPAELDADMELSDEARAWVKKCDDLLSYSDEDGIVCIPSVRGEASAADQLLNLLAAAYGDSWSNDKLSGLLKQADHAGKPLETWLREKFFTQHCKLFQHRPFIWHIWDGLRDGFAALVNYHKLDKKLLETLIYTYLGDWISRQKQDIANGVDGSQEKLDAAESLKKKLELILEGETPYDIFVRWKPIAKQPIGWDPDLNDGIRLNIRPFMSVPDVSKKDAGVLRDKPNINWNKDRGTDVESAPWYNLGLEYGGKKGDRINDHHLSLKQKKEARVAAK